MDILPQRAMFVVLAIAAAGISSCVRVLSHDPTMAAQAAQEFANVAFVDREFTNAHDRLTKHMQSTCPPEKLQAEVTKMHLSGYPSIVTATDYEPMPGQAGMNIFLVGENANEKFYYRLLIEGTEDTGYKVSGLWRGNGPYPSSSLRRSLTN